MYFEPSCFQQCYLKLNAFGFWSTSIVRWLNIHKLNKRPITVIKSRGGEAPTQRTPLNGADLKQSALQLCAQYF